MKTFLLVAAFVAVALGSMDGLPLVSVVVPTSRQGLLPHLIDQVDKQDYGKIELIIVDDSETPFEDARLSHSWVRYYYLPERMSIGEKRNFGLSRAKGQLIAHWDDDDFFRFDRLREQIRPIVYGQADVTFIEHQVMWDVKERKFLNTHVYDLDPHYATMIFRKPDASLQLAYPDSSMAEDYAMAEQLIGAGYRMQVLPNTDGMHVYVRHGTNTMENNNEDAEFMTPVAPPSSLTTEDFDFYYSEAFAEATSQGVEIINAQTDTSMKWNVPEMNANQYLDRKRQTTFMGMCPMNYMNSNNCPIETTGADPSPSQVSGSGCAGFTVDLSGLFEDVDNPIVCSNLVDPSGLLTLDGANCLVTGSHDGFEVIDGSVDGDEDYTGLDDAPQMGSIPVTADFELTLDCLTTVCTTAGAACQPEGVVGAEGTCQVPAGGGSLVCLLETVTVDTVEEDLTGNDPDEPNLNFVFSGEVVDVQDSTGSSTQIFTLNNFATFQVDGSSGDDELTLTFDSSDPTTTDFNIDGGGGNDSLTLVTAGDATFDISTGAITTQSNSASGSTNIDNIIFQSPTSLSLVASATGLNTDFTAAAMDGVIQFTTMDGGSPSDTVSVTDDVGVLTLDLGVGGINSINLGDGVLDGLTSAVVNIVTDELTDSVIAIGNSNVAFNLMAGAVNGLVITEAGTNTIMADAVELSGTVTVEVPAGFPGTPGTSFTILSSAALTGSPTLVAGESVPAGGMLTQNGNNIILSFPSMATGGGDPHMVGFYGQRYNFKGVLGQHYNFLSFQDLQINVRMTGEVRHGGEATTLMDDVYINFEGHELEWTPGKSPMLDGHRMFTYASVDLHTPHRTRDQVFSVTYEGSKGRQWRKHSIDASITIEHPEGHYKLLINCIEKHQHKDWYFFDIDVNLNSRHSASGSYVPVMIGNGGFLGQTMNDDDPIRASEAFEIAHLKDMPTIQ